MHQKTWTSVGTMFALAGIAGCGSQGLSSRETGMQSYSEVVYPATPQAPVQPGFTARGNPTAEIPPADMPPSLLPTTGPVHLDLPARVSVAQIGEITPPDSMLAALRDHSNLFSKVSPQVGNFKSKKAGEDPHERLEQMRIMARNLGSQYLLVFGGNIDSGQQETGLVVLNLTIVGAFIVPTTGVSVSGKAAGSLVDVNSGRVLMNFSSDTKGTGMAPSAFATNAETVAVDTAKDTLVKKLTEDVIRQMGEQSKPPVAMAK